MSTGTNPEFEKVWFCYLKKSVVCRLTEVFADLSYQTAKLIKSSQSPQSFHSNFESGLLKIFKNSLSDSFYSRYTQIFY